MIAPFWISAPESRLPVCGGGMPWPVRALLNRPSITLILCFSGSSGDRVLLSFMSAPEPSALQLFSLMPLPMNMTPKRFGNTAEAVGSPKAGSDSSQGRATATPAPRRTARRERRGGEFWVDFGILVHLSLKRGGLGACFLTQNCISLVEELGTGDDSLDQRTKAITIGGKFALHAVYDQFVGKQQRT